MQGTKKLPTTSEYFVFISFLNWIEVDPQRKQLRGKLLLFDQCKFNMVITMPKKEQNTIKVQVDSDRTVSKLSSDLSTSISQS